MPTRHTARIAGLLYLLTFAASIPALPLLTEILGDPAFVLGSGPTNAVLAGALLDLINAGACIGTAVVLYPVLRRHGPAGALGFVTTRVVEAVIITTGVISLLTVVTLRTQASADQGPALLAVAAALVALRDWTFLLGPGLMSGLNALLLGSVLLRSQLIPRAIPILGLIGAPLHLAAVMATFFGVNDQLSLWSGLAVVPVFLWELSVGLWMAVKGFSVGRSPGWTGAALPIEPLSS
jgi:hypothetical protein